MWRESLSVPIDFSKIPQNMVRAGTWAWAPIRSKLVPMLLVLGTVAIVMLVVRPFGQGVPDANTLVAAEWNSSVRKLGLEPVYPPQEDFYVGDLLAEIIDPCLDKTDAERLSQQTICDASLRDFSIRLGHISLRSELQRDPTLPLFSDTRFRSQTDDYRVQSTDEVQQQPSHELTQLTLAAIPGLTISHSSHRAGNVGWSGWSFNANQDDREREELKIPTVETYGVDPAVAFKKLNDFCTAPETKPACQDQYIRRLISYVLGDSVLKVEHGQYVARFQLKYVFRAFLSREISLEHSFVDASGLGLQGRADASAALETSPTGAAVGQPAVKPPQAGGSLKNDSVANTSGAKSLALAEQGDNGLAVKANQVYQRPLVFGYRAITVAIAPSCPTGRPITGACHLSNK